MCVTVALNAQYAENEDPVFDSDTTGKVNFKKTALFNLTDLETWVMHYLRSKIEYGEIKDGEVFKLVPDRSRFIVNYENAKYIVWIKNDDVIKKQIEYDGEILTTRYKE